jgi:hypothetical protein
MKKHLSIFQKLEVAKLLWTNITNCLKWHRHVRVGLFKPPSRGDLGILQG